VTYPDAGIAAQIRNIEATYGKPLDEWFGVIRAGGATKHTEIIEMLKDHHGMKHGAAHRVALLARQAQSPQTADQHLAELYAGKKAHLRPIHDRLIAIVDRLGGAEIVPKRGYVGLRRDKQFAMIQPSTTSRVDLGLILPDTPPTARLEPADKFNALFTHRVRITTPDEINDKLIGWLSDAYARASRPRSV
jgi:hypothetical protein